MWGSHLLAQRETTEAALHFSLGGTICFVLLDWATVPLYYRGTGEEEEDRNMRRVIISDLRNIFIISRFDLTPD